MYLLTQVPGRWPHLSPERASTNRHQSLPEAYTRFIQCTPEDCHCNEVVHSTSLLTVVVRGTTEDMYMMEEFVRLVPLKGSTTGPDVFEATFSYLTDLNLAMVADRNGDCGIIKLHVHQETLCAKSATLNGWDGDCCEGFLIAWGLNHRQFQQLLIGAEEICCTSLKFDGLVEDRCCTAFGTQKIGCYFPIQLQEMSFGFTFLWTRVTFPDWPQLPPEFTELVAARKERFLDSLYARVAAFEVKLRLWERQLDRAELVHFERLAILAREDFTTCTCVFSDFPAKFAICFSNHRSMAGKVIVLWHCCPYIPKWSWLSCSSFSILFIASRHFLHRCSVPSGRFPFIYFLKWISPMTESHLNDILVLKYTWSRSSPDILSLCSRRKRYPVSFIIKIIFPNNW